MNGIAMILRRTSGLAQGTRKYAAKRSLSTGSSHWPLTAFVTSCISHSQVMLKTALGASGRQFLRMSVAEGFII